MKESFISDSPKLYFLPYMQMSKNTFPHLRKGVWFEFSGPRQTSKWCVLPLHRAVRYTQPRLSRTHLGLTGLEPVTLRLSSACSNQLSYRPKAGLAKRRSLEVRGLEPLTYSLQSYRSTS